MNLPFIQELTEARMFRQDRSFNGMRLSKISEITYYFMLAIEIMRFEDPAYARSYAGQTIRYNKFQGMMSSATDMHNLYTICTHSNEYIDKIKIDIKTEVPFNLVRRYMFDIKSNIYFSTRVRGTFMALESGLKVRNSQAKRLRREVTDWKFAERASKEFAIRSVYQFLRENAVFADITRQFIDTVFRNIKNL